MRHPFGVTPARSCLHLTPWIAASHGIEGAASVLPAVKNSLPTRPMNVNSRASAARSLGDHTRGKVRLVSAINLELRQQLVDQLIIFLVEWIDERDALQHETILQIFGKQVPHARTPCRSP
jgi:hypothetical protein